MVATNDDVVNLINDEDHNQQRKPQQQQQHHEKVYPKLRFHASDVASLAGYRPSNLTCMIELFEKYLYQDRYNLFVQDCHNVDVVCIDKNVKINMLIDLLPYDSKKIIRDAIATPITGSTSVRAATTKLEGILNSSIVKKNIPLQQDQNLLKELLSNKYKFYGTLCESTAIKRYESVYNVSVVQCNEKLLEWISEGDKLDFKIIGKVDGLVYKDSSIPVDDSSHDNDTGSATTTLIDNIDVTVIEIKNRVNYIQTPPKLYDQIQLVTYMMMLKSTTGHLIQTITENNDTSGLDENGKFTDNSGTNGSIRSIGSSAKDSTSINNSKYDKGNSKDFHVYEIDLKKELHAHHLIGFTNHIIPNLQLLSSMIHLYRIHDELRYNWLLCDDSVKVQLLLNHCTYFDELDYFNDIEMNSKRSKR